MARPAEPRFHIPLQLVGLNFFGAFVAAFGSWGLFDPDAPARAPALANPALAWTCIGVGAGLMVYTVIAILLRGRKAMRAKAP
jgi:hypothetical protein